MGLRLSAPKKGFRNFREELLRMRKASPRPRECQTPGSTPTRWRRDAALEEARQRGLDEAERRKAAAAANRVPRRNNRKRDPDSHARVLLNETSLPLEEISVLTGLDVYEVVALKLKMRQEALIHSTIARC